MKTIFFIEIFILIIYLASCSDRADSTLIHGDKTCYSYKPIKSKWPFDEESGICFFNDGKCFDYVLRNGMKIPFGNMIVDVNDYHLEEILANWSISGDSLFVGSISYVMKGISDDTILLENSTDVIYLIKDNRQNETYWGHVIDEIPEKYVN